MGEKNKKNNGDEQPTGGSAENNKKKDNGGGGGGSGGGKNNVTVVLKADLHCEGCVSKVLKCIRSFDGVDTASIGGGHIITAVGKVDPAKLRERVEQKTHKKVELVSPLPKKDNNNSSKENAKGKENNGGDNGKQESKKKKESNDKNSKNKSDEKKSKEKEPPVTTAVLKMHLHCEGCIQKIYKRVTKTKGYQGMKIDRQKEQITVTGAMDMTALAELLKKHLKKDVQILPPKKEAEKKENDKGNGKNNGGGGEKGKNNGGDKGKGGGGGGDGGNVAGGSGEVVEGNRMQFQVGYPYSYPFMYGAGGVVDQFHSNPYAFVHAPQIFSDENPNACSVM